MAWMSARHVERRQSFGLVTPTGVDERNTVDPTGRKRYWPEVEVVPDMPIVPLIHFRDTSPFFQHARHAY